MRRLEALVLVVAVATGAWASGAVEPPEELPADRAPTGGSEQPAEATGPVAYERSEFPEWAYTLRRAEVTAIGSLPLTLFGVRVLYGFARYATHGFAADVRPFPFRPIGGGAALTNTEILGIAIGAAVLSITIAVIDADLRGAARENDPDL